MRPAQIRPCRALGRAFRVLTRSEDAGPGLHLGAEGGEASCHERTVLFLLCIGDAREFAGERVRLGGCERFQLPVRVAATQHGVGLDRLKSHRGRLGGPILPGIVSCSSSSVRSRYKAAAIFADCASAACLSAAA
jgi:hypothetical protein